MKTLMSVVLFTLSMYYNYCDVPVYDENEIEYVTCVTVDKDLYFPDTPYIPCINVENISDVIVLDENIVMEDLLLKVKLYHSEVIEIEFLEWVE